MDILHANFTATPPFDIFRQWLDKARETEPNDPEAMALATVGTDGMPAVRMVLLKSLEGDSFCFHTNMESRKGRDIMAHPVAALCFHWKTQQRQVRVEGDVEPLPDDVSDAYYKTRPGLSRLQAWASRQSEPLESREALEARVRGFAAKFGQSDIPRPPYWGGYRIRPRRIEFWQAGEGRLHDRFLFEKQPDGRWHAQRLNP